MTGMQETTTERTTEQLLQQLTEVYSDWDRCHRYKARPFTYAAVIAENAGFVEDSLQLTPALFDQFMTEIDAYDRCASCGTPEIILQDGRNTCGFCGGPAFR